MNSNKNLFDAQGEKLALVYFPAKEKKSDAAMVIFPGGAYAFLAEHEGRDYAEFFNSIGYDAFVCAYRVAPHCFPEPLIDARRAVRNVRFHSEKLGIDKNKIAVVGSSAGGNLAALLCTYLEKIDGEGEKKEDDECFLPNFQILCYPVISLVNDSLTHADSKRNLLGKDRQLAELLSPELHVTADTPPAFLWHTAEDGCVPVENTLLYTQALKRAGVSVETHIFPHGGHGMGLAKNDPSVSLWTALLENRLRQVFG